MACSCNIAGMFDIELEGIISASMNASADIRLTSDGIVLIGPSFGTINLVAYPYPPHPTDEQRVLGVKCPTRVGASINWQKRYDCDENKYYFIPQYGGTAWIEGDTPDGVSFELGPYSDYTSFNASASSGPATVYLDTHHYDGFNLIYTGRPIAFESGRPEPLNILSNKLPSGVELYLQSFSLDINPPFSSQASYSFVFVYSLP